MLLIRESAVEDLQQCDDSASLAPLMRASVIEVDMLMYAAIVGQVPQIVPVEQISATPIVVARPVATPELAWSPIILNIHLRAAYRQNPLMLATPEIAA